MGIPSSTGRSIKTEAHQGAVTVDMFTLPAQSFTKTYIFKLTLCL